MIREALMGTQRDFTEDSIGRAIFILSVPMVLEMCMESLFGIVNVFWVSRLGADAVAAVGITESLLTIIFAIALGLSMATTAVVARRTGEKDSKGAAIAAVQGIILGVAVSVPIGLIGLLFATDLLRVMGATPEVITTGSSYTKIVLGLNVVVMLLFLVNAVFRGAGDATVAMRSLWLGNLINLVLDPCLIFGLGPFPELGVMGSAIATTIGRGAGVVYQFAMLFSKRSRIVLRRDDIRFEPEIALNMLRISLGGMFQYLVATASWLASRPHRRSFWECGPCGLHDRDQDHHRCPSAIVGNEQRSSDACGPESWRRKTGSRRKVGLDHGARQHGLPGNRRDRLHLSCGAGDWHLHFRPGCSSVWRGVSALHQLRLHLLCLRNGDGPIVQRRR